MSVKAILTCIAIVILLILGSCGTKIYYDDKIEKAEIATGLAKGDAVVSDQEVELGKVSGKIYTSGVANRRRLEGVNTENVTKLQATTGAEFVPDPAFVNQLNDGMCKYDATVGCPSD